jgi:hypothetical protein
VLSFDRLDDDTVLPQTFLGDEPAEAFSCIDDRSELLCADDWETLPSVHSVTCVVSSFTIHMSMATSRMYRGE